MQIGEYISVEQVKITSSTTAAWVECCIPCVCECTVWVKKIQGTRHFSFFSANGWEFLIDFLHTYYTFLSTLNYNFFIPSSPILTKFCLIKRDYPVHIICSKCPPSPIGRDACFRRLLSRRSLSVANHYKINTFIMSTNMLDMTWRQQWRHLLSKQT